MHPDSTSKLEQLKERAGLGRVPTSVIALILVAAIALIGYAAWSWYVPSSGDGVTAELYGQSSIDDTASAQIETEGASSAAPATPPDQGRITVHVVGAVKTPGVYELESGARVGDAIAAAGGVTGEAEVRAVNFAAVATDGTQVVVPTVKEVESGTAAMGATAASGVGGVSGSGDAAVNTGVGANGVVNINTADATTLETLPGIGPATSAKIIADREKNGPFKATSDLQRVSGIGPKKYEALTGLISVQ